MPDLNSFREALRDGGIFELAAQLHELKNSTQETAAAQEALDRILAKGRFRQLAIDAQELRKETERATAATREMMDVEGRQRALKSGKYVGQVRTEQDTRFAKAKTDLEERRARLSSGAYTRELAQVRQVVKEKERIEKMERRADLAARYGRVGGGVVGAAHTPFIRGVGTAAGAVGATALGMGMSGFSGTVEWNRLQLELSMISRELAGAFKPAIEATTRSLQGLRKWLEHLSPRGQDAVALGVGAVGINFAMKRLLGVGLIGAAAGGGAALGRLAGVGAASAAAGIMQGGNWSGVNTGAGTGAAAAGGGALARGGAFALRAARILPVVFVAAASLDDETEKVPWRKVARKAGMNKVQSWAVGAAASVDRWFGLSDESDAVRKAKFAKKHGIDLEEMAGGKKPDPSRRMVTIADAGFESPGSAWERISQRLALVDANDTGPRETNTILEEIARMIRNVVVGDAPEMK